VLGVACPVVFGSVLARVPGVLSAIVKKNNNE